MRAPAILLLCLLTTACVTINVYFPAAEAEQAAREFVEHVIGDDAASAEPQPQAEPPPPPPPSATRTPALSLLGWLVADAHAQDVDITLRTPAIQAIQDRMAERFQSRLAAAFDAGALGFGNNGLLVLRDPAKLALKDRAALNQALADDNRDRDAVYREIAVANGHPEWEAQIRATFARQWIASARSGWWYQDEGGAWKQK